MLTGKRLAVPSVATALLVALALTVGGPLLAPQAHEAGAKPVVIRRALGGPPPSDIMKMLFLPWMQKNVLKHYGKVYTLDIIPTRSTTIAASLMAAGEADIGTLALSSFASTVTKNAVDGGVSIIADTKIDGFKGYRSIVYSVRKDSGINSVKDLKGKTVGINTYGAIVDIAIRLVMKKHGLNPKDVNFAELKFPHIGKAILDGRIATGPLLQPFEELAHRSGKLKPLFYMKDGLGPAQVIFQVARNTFLKEHPNVVRAYLADYQTALKWFKNPANREKMIDLVSKATKRPAKLYNSYFLKPNDDYRATSLCPYVEYIQKPLDLIRAEGVLKQRVDVAAHIDTSFLPGPCT